MSHGLDAVTRGECPHAIGYHGVRDTAYSPHPRPTPYSAMFSRETQALMEAAVDAVIVIDQRGLFRRSNDTTLNMFGYGSVEMLG